jgi:lipoate-protein ligase A
LIDDVEVRRTADEQMQADLEMLQLARETLVSTLRVYTWSMPTLSIGHFQTEADIDAGACARHEVDVVRRPTGGAALLHGGDLTYAVAMPLDSTRMSVQAVYDRIARGLIAGLANLDVEAAVARHDGASGPVCFAGQQGADLRVGDRKICGSAQVRRERGVLQHGSILLRRLDIDETDLISAPQTREQLRRATVTLAELGAPTAPRAVADALIAGFAQAFGVTYR